MASNIGKEATITWEDAWSNDHTYFNLRSIGEEQPLLLKSTGVIIRDNKDGVSIARDYPVQMDDSGYRGVQHIPRGMVRKVKILK